jgi:tellurite methyltransferase
LSKGQKETAMFDEKYPEVDPNKRTAVQIWEERYGSSGYIFGKEPVLALKNHVSALRKGKALDVAMGEGRNSVYLASQGFQVEGVDCSAKAIEKAKALAAEKKVSIEAKTQNLDFFLMPLMKYDTILMTYYKPAQRFFSEIRRGLVQGGTFLLEAYTTEHMKGEGSKNPLIDFDQCYKPNEILHQLKEFHIMFYKEIPDGNSHLVQVIAQKTGK